MPSWLTAILLLIAFVIVTTLVYKTTIVLYNKKIAEIDALKEKCKTETEEKIAAYIAIRNLMRSEMIGLVKECMTKGYTEEEDRQIFADLFEVYGKLKGNHDVEEKKKVFYSLPYYEHARRTEPHLIYEQLEREGTWIYDNSIPDSALKPDVANIRRVKTGKGSTQE